MTKKQLYMRRLVLTEAIKLVFADPDGNDCGFVILFEKGDAYATVRHCIDEVRKIATPEGCWLPCKTKAFGKMPS